MRHDSGYKLIFGNAEMIRDLLVGFVDEPWVAQIDFSTLARVSGSYVTDDLRDREDDIIWRVNIHGQPVYVYILLEFQSTVDKFMAVRIMGYLALLYQDLIAAGKLTDTGNLPPVFPMVLYNGQARWWAKRDVSELIDNLPQGLASYVPQMRYFLLEIGVVDESSQLLVKNLVAALMRLEKSREPGAMLAALSDLVVWLKAPARQRLRRAFTVWVNRVLLPARLPGVALPRASSILEVETMLAERVIEWTQQWAAEGLEKGLEKGRQEGREEGRQEGLQNALAQILQAQLELRFGPLPDWALARLKESSVDERQRWCLRVVTQSSLQEILN
ncbi:MAG: hypothetical protein RL748_1405 [Pseudomonadota bacterium]|jgi:predicted transposase/invertase (TIGR01784 family)